MLVRRTQLGENFQLIEGVIKALYVSAKLRQGARVQAARLLQAKYIELLSKKYMQIALNVIENVVKVEIFSNLGDGEIRDRYLERNVGVEIICNLDTNYEE